MNYQVTNCSPGVVKHCIFFPVRRKSLGSGRRGVFSLNFEWCSSPALSKSLVGIVAPAIDTATAIEDLFPSTRTCSHLVALWHGVRRRIETALLPFGHQGRFRKRGQVHLALREELLRKPFGQRVLTQIVLDFVITADWKKACCQRWRGNEKLVNEERVNRRNDSD